MIIFWLMDNRLFVILQSSQWFDGLVILDNLSVQSRRVFHTKRTIAYLIPNSVTICTQLSNQTTLSARLSMMFFWRYIYFYNTDINQAMLMTLKPFGTIAMTNKTLTEGDWSINSLCVLIFIICVLFFQFYVTITKLSLY